MERWWIDAAREALDKFEVVRQEGSWHSWQWMEAQADTGSRYEMATIPHPDGTLVAVVSPWERVYVKGHGEVLHPVYFAEKWGKPNCRLSEMHGGDAYALMKMMSLLCGVMLVLPEELPVSERSQP